jgi:predicted peroxiredoxin/TusA-related sulfurtransferase
LVCLFDLDGLVDVGLHRSGQPGNSLDRPELNMAIRIRFQKSPPVEGIGADRPYPTTRPFGLMTERALPGGWSMETITAGKTLNRTGKTITTFVVFDAFTELEAMNEGDVLEVLTDDFEPFPADLSAWCRTTGHRLLASDKVATGYRFLIEKGSPKTKETSLAMIISSDGLEELLSPLGFALGAALEGIDVHMYFQGPAVRVLTKGFRPRLKGWARPFTRFAAAGMTKSGHIPAQEKLRQLRRLGAHLYVCGGSLQPFKVKRDDLMFDDLPIVEYLTFMSVMEGADIHLYI